MGPKLQTEAGAPRQPPAIGQPWQRLLRDEPGTLLLLPEPPVLLHYTSPAWRALLRQQGQLQPALAQHKCSSRSRNGVMHCAESAEWALLLALVWRARATTQWARTRLQQLVMEGGGHSKTVVETGKATPHDASSGKAKRHIVGI